RSAQVKELVVELLAIPQHERDEVLKNGVSHVDNQIDWARFFLAKAGYLASSKRGVWALTEKGRNAQLTGEDIRQIVRSVNAASSAGVSQSNDEETGEE